MSSGRDISHDRGPGPTGGATAATPKHTGYYSPHSEPGGPTLPRHLYVHVPLCRAKCAYCDFYSVSPETAGLPDDPIALQLLKQAEAWLSRGVQPSPLRTLYVGGGTPTMLGGGLPFLVEGIRRAFGLLVGAEVTVEANPDSLDESLVRMLAPAGVTRVSLGVQSCHDDELRALGRVHDTAQAVAAARLVVAAGLDLSVDLMCGISQQTDESWRESLARMLDSGCSHVSVYPLSVEEGTPLADAVAHGQVRLPEDDAVASMMEWAAEELSGAGFVRYEVANYARPGHESAHNTAYWTGAEYLGVGPSAHGMLSVSNAAALGLPRFGKNTSRVRYSVAADLWEGLEPAPPLDLEYLTEAEALREDAMLGMRMAEGIAEELAERAGATRALEAVAELGLVTRSAHRWRMTERGWLLGNEVFSKVWLADE